MTATPTSGVLATFDNVRLAGRRSAAVVPGAADPRMPDVLVRLRDGSVFVGMLNGLSASDPAPAQARIKKSGGQTFSVPVASLARAQFAPLTRDDLEKISADTAGALTSDGDFLAGDIKQVQPENVTVSSVNFGLTNIEHRRVTVVIFQPMAPATSHFAEVHLQDGSLVIAKKLTVDKDELIVDEPLAGPMKFPLKDVLSIDRTAELQKD
jgi:hypothetical protein